MKPDPPVTNESRGSKNIGSSTSWIPRALGSRLARGRAGIGTQVEAFLYYYVTPQFSIGAGGRYWAMWTTSGADCREPPNGACPAPLQNMQFKTERIGMLFQAAYKFDEPAPIVTK